MPTFANPVAGEVITAVWGQGIHADQTSNEANRIHRDGSIPMTGTFQTLDVTPTVTVTSSLGSAGLRYLKVWAQDGDFSGTVAVATLNGTNVNATTALKLNGTTVVNASLAAINLSGGISPTGTAAKIVRDLGNHRQQLWNSFLGNVFGAGTTTLTGNLWTTSPMPATFFGALIRCVPRTAVDPSLFFSQEYNVTSTGFDIKVVNNTGGAVTADIYALPVSTG